VDVAEGPGQLNRKVSPEAGVDVLGTVCAGRGLRDQGWCFKGTTNGRVPRRAKKVFRNCCTRVQTMLRQAGELLNPMARAVRIIEGYLEEILSHRPRGLTTAFTAKLNSLLAAMKRKAREFGTMKCLAAMLFFVFGNLSLTYYLSTESREAQKPNVLSLIGRVVDSPGSCIISAQLATIEIFSSMFSNAYQIPGGILNRP
jgi:hypothetical protein